MKKIRTLRKLITDKDYMTKVKIFFSSKTAGDDFDPYEDNYTLANLNPQTIKAYVREVSPETAFYKQYGIHQAGMKEIICDDRYRNWFENCNKIEIDSTEYQTFRAGTGSKTMIVKRPHQMIRVVVSRKD